MYAQEQLHLNPYQPPATSVNELDMLINHKMFSTFAGKNSSYYHKKWHLRRYSETKSTGFNLAAMFYGPLWFLYRRMYAAFFLITLIMIVQGIIQHYVFNIAPINLSQPFAAGNMVGLSLSVVLGFVANTLYFKHAQRIIFKYADDNHNKAEIIKKLEKRKSTDWLSALSMTVLLVLLTYGSIILL